MKLKELLPSCYDLYLRLLTKNCTDLTNLMRQLLQSRFYDVLFDELHRAFLTPDKNNLLTTSGLDFGPISNFLAGDIVTIEAAIILFQLALKTRGQTFSVHEVHKPALPDRGPSCNISVFFTSDSVSPESLTIVFNGRLICVDIDGEECHDADASDEPLYDAIRRLLMEENEDLVMVQFKSVDIELENEPPHRSARLMIDFLRIVLCQSLDDVVVDLVLPTEGIQNIISFLLFTALLPESAAFNMSSVLRFGSPDSIDETSGSGSYSTDNTLDDLDEMIINLSSRDLKPRITTQHQAQTVETHFPITYPIFSF